MSYIPEKPSMKVIYDQETDSLSELFSEGHVAESDDGKPGIVLDYADDGRLLAIEILDASSRMAIPKNVEFGAMLPMLLISCHIQGEARRAAC